MESALTFLQRYHDDGDEVLEQDRQMWWKMGSTHYPRNQAAVNALVDLPSRRNSSRLCRPRKWCARCSWTDEAFSSSTSWPEVRQWMLSVIAKHCRNYDEPYRTSGAGCLIPVLSCCTITLGHTRLDGQHISFRSSPGRCLINHPIARTSRPLI